MDTVFEEFYKVYIIESFATNDLHLCESEYLSQHFNKLNIPYKSYSVNNKAEFAASLKLIKEDMIEVQYEEKPCTFFFPIIHISCHGNEGCIGFSNKEYINWSELKDMFIKQDYKIPEIDINSLTLSISSCCGLYAIYADSLKEIKGSSPFAYVIGNENSITSIESSEAYAAYYENLISKGKSMIDSIEYMNQKINKRNYFKLFLSKDTYQFFSKNK